MSTELLITNIGFVLTTVITMVLGLFVLAKGPHNKQNILFFLFCLFISIFTASHVLGVNQQDPTIARAIFMWNACNIFIVVFGAHWTLAVIGKDVKRKIPLYIIYTLGAGLFFFYMLFPETFMGAPKPVMYFPNFYGEGPLYFVMVLLFVLILIYFMFELYFAYRHGNAAEKNKLKYVMVGFTIGFLAGLILELPLFGVYVDPILSIFIWVFTIPLSYTMIANNLMDMKVVAKQATIYALSVVLVTILIIIVNTLSVVISQNIPNFPTTLIPILSSVIVVLIGRFIWAKIKDAEVLKYEFITIVTHKFRTPLTSIKWAADVIRNTSDPEEIRRNAGYIEKANTDLVELTDILLQSSEAESTEWSYHNKPVSLKNIVERAVETARETARPRGVEIRTNIPADIPDVIADERRIQFVVQIVVDNAVIYTPSGKSVAVSLSRDGDRVVCTVSDQGIGISKEELPHIFTKFYRSERATKTDTEGVGLGLFMAKSIIEKQGGSISAASLGEGKGTTVTLKLKTKA